MCAHSSELQDMNAYNEPRLAIFYILDISRRSCSTCS